jgi:sugar lactone lactonase YvrE
VENAENNDWEDITKDIHGNIYVGDFGNNDNDSRIFRS